MPMTPQDRVTFDALINHITKQDEQERLAVERVKAEKEARERATEIAIFRMELKEALGAEWVKLLALEFSETEAKATFSDGEVEFSYFPADKFYVNLINKRLEKAKRIRLTVVQKETLFFVQAVREALKKELERQETAAAFKAQKEAEYEAALPIDAEIRLKIDALHAEKSAEFAFDAYPIVLYQMIYTSASGETESLWTIHDHLMDDGSIVGYDHNNQRHEIRLLPHVHLPRWEKFVFNTLDDLPYHLKEEGYQATLDGVNSRFFSAGNRDLYVYEEGSSIEVNNWEIQRPVAWLRAVAQTIADARQDAKGTDVPNLLGSTWDTAEQRLQTLLAALEPLVAWYESDQEFGLAESLIRQIVEITEQLKAH